MFPHYFSNPMRKIKPDGGYTSIFRTIGFIGDSLASGEHESYDEKDGKGWHDYYEYSWGQYIGRKCGLKAINFSRGGLTASEFFDFVTSKEHPSAINVFDEANKCQAYVIALGVNDINHLNDKYTEYGFGSFDDVDWENEDNNKPSFVGCYVKIIQKLKKIQPKCRVFVMSIPKSKPVNKTNEKWFIKLSGFLNDLTKRFEFTYCIDLWKYLEYDEKKLKGTLFLGGHMNAAGYKFTGDIVSTYIDYIIRHNWYDFAQVGFIGKDVHNESEKW